MRQNRFYIKEKIKDLSEITITDSDVNHQIKNVLRLRAGDEVCFFDDDGTEFLGKLISITQQGSNFVKEKINFFSNKNEENKLKLRLIPAVIKKDKFDWVVQKATELGVFSIDPIISERTEKLNLNLDRLKKIAIEASEQSGRNSIPEIKEPVPVDYFLENLSSSEKQNCFVLDFCETKINVSQMKDLSELFILIGPEGGWGDKDLEILKEHGIKRISLGEQILRAETASIAVCSILLLG